MQNFPALRAESSRILAEAELILNRSETEERGLNDAEQQRFDSITARAAAIKAEIAGEQKPTFRGQPSGEPDDTPVSEWNSSRSRMPSHGKLLAFKNTARGREEAHTAGRFLAATAGLSVASVIGKAVRDGKTCYYINDGVYHTYSGVIFDHCKYPVMAFKKGPTSLSSVFGPTCDALDVVSMAENLPNLERGDLVYSVNIGAYSHASATYFNGFPPAKVVHENL